MVCVAWLCLTLDRNNVVKPSLNISRRRDKSLAQGKTPSNGQRMQLHHLPGTVKCSASARWSPDDRKLRN